MSEEAAEKVRAAGVRTPDRLLVGKSTAEIVKKAKSEIDSTVRVYVKEWLFTKRGTQAECQEYFEKTYAGRIYRDDMKVELEEWSGDYILYLKQWNARAEWKQMELGERHVELIKQTEGDVEAQAVARNSRTEHNLLAYGKLKLPDAD